VTGEDESEALGTASQQLYQAAFQCSPIFPTESTMVRSGSMADEGGEGSVLFIPCCEGIPAGLLERSARFRAIRAAAASEYVEHNRESRGWLSRGARKSRDAERFVEGDKHDEWGPPRQRYRHHTMATSPSAQSRRTFLPVVTTQAPQPEEGDYPDDSGPHHGGSEDGASAKE
jgi:hypothetical protein